MNKQERQKPITLHPLAFDEAVADILKVKPEPKQPRKRARAKKRAKRGQRPGGGT
jgi:hypothetical protein